MAIKEMYLNGEVGFSPDLNKTHNLKLKIQSVREITYPYNVHAALFYSSFGSFHICEGTIMS